MTARDIIAGAVPPEVIAAAWKTWRVRYKDQLGPGPAFVEAITAAIEAYRAAGYRILAPGELDGETLERAAREAECFGAYPAPGNDGFGTMILPSVNGRDIASAIRALRESGG